MFNTPEEQIHLMTAEFVGWCIGTGFLGRPRGGVSKEEYQRTGMKCLVEAAHKMVTLKSYEEVMMGHLDEIHEVFRKTAERVKQEGRRKKQEEEELFNVGLSEEEDE